ncbi:hypothetical protein VTK56DRAFT_6203 [Thermocarpiscus australiensis]
MLGVSRLPGKGLRHRRAGPALVYGCPAAAQEERQHHQLPPSTLRQEVNCSGEEKGLSRHRVERTAVPSDGYTHIKDRHRRLDSALPVTPRQDEYPGISGSIVFSREYTDGRRAVSSYPGTGKQARFTPHVRVQSGCITHWQRITRRQRRGVNGS